MNRENKQSRIEGAEKRSKQINVSTIKLNTEHNINNTTQFNRTSKKDGGAQQGKENSLADRTDY